MKIIIDTDCKENEEKVMFYIKRFCREHFRDCKIQVNELKEEINWEK